MKHAIGIIGGMGPEASIYMYDRLIQLSIQNFGAKKNNDFPEIILHSVPVPDFISSSKEKAIAFKMLQQRVTSLNKLPLSSLSIACNTAHVLLKDLEKGSPVKFISMITSVVKALQVDSIKNVGILATPSTLNSRLYQEELQKYGIKSITPHKEQVYQIENVIRNVIEGVADVHDSFLLRKIANDLTKRGADGIILGCTELPLIFPKSYKKVRMYDSVEILSLALLRRYYEKV
ncbi:MAG: aspartate/glutamate racemase family protein [Candidatus Levybacteria bacterium]|nr:aspartate/glutamate racemase family protein [Candidatus Levybacteria bacterium]